MGLAAVVTGAKRVSLTMFSKAAETLSTLVAPEQLAKGIVYPDISQIRDVSHKIAVAVAEVAYQENLATKEVPENMTLEDYIHSSMYRPIYKPYVHGSLGYPLE